ncbi:hypothetical protein PMAYCL1PPCAC_04532, partial [Pristionchus mayeri]
LCGAHGVTAHQRSHVCPFTGCDCTLCGVVRERRAIVARQLRMRREEQKAGNASSLSYTCNRCRNHGLTVLKKGHKNQCPYEACTCPSCSICRSRSLLDASFRQSIQQSRGRVAKSVSPSPVTSPEPARRRAFSEAPIVDSPPSSPLLCTSPILLDLSFSRPYPALFPSEGIVHVGSASVAILNYRPVTVPTPPIAPVMPNLQAFADVLSLLRGGNNNEGGFAPNPFHLNQAATHNVPSIPNLIEALSAPR